MRLSNFNLYVGASDGSIIVRNTKTGGIVRMSKRAHATLVSGDVSPLPASLVSTLEHSGIIVHDDKDEYRTWTEQVFDMRDYHAELFTLHFIPTIQCQLRCKYCFENGVDRGHSMTTETFESGVNWVDTYLNHHPELKRFKLIFFGGEPLLCKRLVLKACESYQEVVSRYNLDFQVELVTNGELLTLDFVKRFAVYPWNRVQITLDGEREIHNARRPGNKDRDVFEIITTNIKNLLNAKVLPHVNIRL
ncbi:MAG: radical SAM protein [Candidatus Pacebacteria bacterium]|nr:radical SAM protein [Candidatus Paceibacterota bacterium]